MPRTRQSGEGGLYLDRKRKLWIGVVEDGFTPDGRRKQRRVSSKSQSEARRKLEELKQQIREKGSPLATRKTVAEWGAFWLSGYKYKKPQTYRTYESLLKTWVYPTLGKRDMRDIRVSDLRRIYDSMRSAGKSTSTALKLHTMLSSMFEGARKDRLVADNIVKDLDAPRAAKVARDTFTPDETLALLQQSELVRDGSKWAVSLYAGLRQGERLGATVDSIDWGRGLFTVQWNLVEGNYEHGCGGLCGKRHAGHCPEKRLLIPDGIDYRVLEGRLMLVPPKSGEPRTFPIPVGLLGILERHVESLQIRPNPHGLLWPAGDGSPVTGREDQDEWRALLAAAGVEKDATTHWARHTAISDLTAAGVAERVIGEIVGHKSAGVTGRYQHVSSQDALEAMSKLGERRSNK